MLLSSHNPHPSRDRVSIGDGPRTTDYAPRTGRRNFLKRASALALAFGTDSGLDHAAEVSKNSIGYATISWPQNRFSEALETISSLGFAGARASASLNPLSRCWAG